MMSKISAFWNNNSSRLLLAVGGVFVGGIIVCTVISVFFALQVGPKVDRNYQEIQTLKQRYNNTQYRVQELSQAHAKHESQISKMETHLKTIVPFMDQMKLEAQNISLLLSKIRAEVDEVKPDIKLNQDQIRDNRDRMDKNENQHISDIRQNKDQISENRDRVDSNENKIKQLHMYDGKPINGAVSHRFCSMNIVLVIFGLLCGVYCS